MSKKYQNVEQTPKASKFIEIGDHTGLEVAFKASSPQTKVGGVLVGFKTASIRVTEPQTVTGCGTECAVGQVINSVDMSFNVTTVDALDSLKNEMERVFALAKDSLIHGLLPPMYSTFEE